MVSQIMMNSEGDIAVNGQDFKLLVHAGLLWLKANQNTVNALNVFPVPDGDTGTNMVLTIQAAYDEIRDSQESNVGKIAHAVAQGALMGARGNSGVILSQLWRGFARALDNVDTMNIQKLVMALGEARNTAYKGVVRPVEGTILTVAKDVAIAAERIQSTADVNIIIDTILTAANESVENTPNLLPILKQAKVVDSGGKGLYFILEGMAKFVRGESLDKPDLEVVPLAHMDVEDSMETIEPGQDYEVVIDFRPHENFNLQTFYNELEQIGTSIQVGEGDNIYRMHIHVPSDNRYTPIDFTMSFGTITKVYIENLMDQMAQQSTANSESKKEELEFNPFEPGSIAVIAASPGHGIAKIFASLGVAGVVKGGQTMNPSTEEILASFENLPTDKIIILPNNKNIILAAQAASTMTEKKVAVIPCKSVPQGISALLRLMPGMDFESAVYDMTEAINEVETGEITTATRTVEINGVNVQEGQVIALHNGTLIKSCSNIMEATLAIFDECQMEERERITFFYGADTTPDIINDVTGKVSELYPEHEIEVHAGDQPYYQFIISIE